MVGCSSESRTFFPRKGSKENSELTTHKGSRNRGNEERGGRGNKRKLWLGSRCVSGKVNRRSRRSAENKEK